MKTVGLGWRRFSPVAMAACMTVVGVCFSRAQTAAIGATNAPAGHLRTWELPAIGVNGSTNDLLREEELIGPNGQPRWTTQRRFPKVRIYTLAEEEREFEYWTRIDVPKHSDESTEVQHYFEFEMGLPYRLQLDTYLVVRNMDGGFDGPTYYDGQFEMRYAFAKWGELPGNPTLYLEYIWREAAPDSAEGKILFGDELAPRWHWGVNFVIEDETSGEGEDPGSRASNEYSATAGLSYTLLDEKLSIGIEAEDAYTNFKGRRDKFSDEIFVGPSIQYCPCRGTHIDLLPLIGVRGDEAAKIFLNAGWEF